LASLLRGNGDKEGKPKDKGHISVILSLDPPQTQSDVHGTIGGMPFARYRLGEVASNCDHLKRFNALTVYTVCARIDYKIVPVTNFNK
jgi:hypothetical protein